MERHKVSLFAVDSKITESKFNLQELKMPFYENFSITRPTSLGKKVANREALNLLEKILGHKKDIFSVLELGPGRGPFAHACRLHGLSYTCADVSRSSLLTLENVDKKIQTIVPPIPFADQCFDLTFASNLLEHMLDFKNALWLIEEMKRVTRPGGLICHRVPNAMAWGLHFWNGDYTHSFFTTPRTVSQVYLDAGLKIEAIYSVSGFIIGPVARFAALLGKIIPSWIIDHGANPTSRLTKAIYSAKTTFLLGFLIVGRRQVDL